MHLNFKISIPSQALFDRDINPNRLIRTNKNGLKSDTCQTKWKRQVRNVSTSYKRTRIQVEFIKEYKRMWEMPSSFDFLNFLTCHVLDAYVSTTLISNFCPIWNIYYLCLYKNKQITFSWKFSTSNFILDIQ